MVTPRDSSVRRDVPTVDTIFLLSTRHESLQSRVADVPPGIEWPVTPEPKTRPSPHPRLGLLRAGVKSTQTQGIGRETC